MSTSVKGMTVCTPEFHRVVKHYENKVDILGNLLDLSDEICHLVNGNSITKTLEYRTVRDQMKTVFNLYDECDL